jgi:hypothetical protein
MQFRVLTMQLQSIMKWRLRDMRQISQIQQGHRAKIKPLKAYIQSVRHSAPSFGKLFFLTVNELKKTRRDFLPFY